MALAFDATAVAESPNGSGASSATFSHTCSGANRVLLVFVEINNNSSQTVSGITYNGVALSLVDSETNSTSGRVELWKLIAPATGANNIVVTLSAAAQFLAGSMSFTGADQTTPLGTAQKGAFNSPNGGSTSLTVTSATGEIVVDGITSTAGGGSSLTPGGSQTSEWNTFAANGIGNPAERGGGSTQSGAASVTMSWTFGTTGQAGAYMAVNVKPVATAGPNTSGNFFKLF